MARNPVGWFEIYVDDMERAKKFYETVLGVKLEKLPIDIEMFTFPMGEGLTLVQYACSSRGKGLHNI